jgi:hypothetical protein
MEALDCLRKRLSNTVDRTQVDNSRTADDLLLGPRRGQGTTGASSTQRDRLTPPNR